LARGRMAGGLGAAAETDHCASDARKSPGIVSPSIPSPPTFSAARREIAQEWKLEQAEVGVRRLMAS
jgi:hypothetical protein